MSKLSLREAAKLAGRGKTTIHAAIHDGRLTAERNESGGYEIDPAELHRLFPLRVDPDSGQFIEQRTPKDSKDTKNHLTLSFLFVLVVLCVLSLDRLAHQFGEALLGRFVADADCLVGAMEFR